MKRNEVILGWVDVLVFGFEGLGDVWDLVLMDLDGALTDSKRGIVNSVRYALDSMNVFLDEATLEKFIGPPLRNSFMEYCGFDKTGAEKAIAKYREYFVPKGMLENELYPNIIPMLNNFRQMGIVLVIATSKPTIYAEKILSYFNIACYFSTIVGSEMDGARSDKAEIIACVLDELDSSRNMKAVMIGDRKHDIIGANMHKIDSIGVMWGYGGREELEAVCASKIVSSTTELQHIICGV